MSGLGLSLVEEKQIFCSRCNTPLLNIIVSETNDNRKKRGLDSISTKFTVKCYKCSHCSKTKEFDGSTNIAPVAEFVSFEIDKVEKHTDGTISAFVETKGNNRK